MDARIAVPEEGLPAQLGHPQFLADPVPQAQVKPTEASGEAA